MTEQLILALDGLDLATALRLTEEIGRSVYAVKVHDLVDKQGYEVIRLLKYAGANRVWVDYKLHDIPKTVGRRAKALHAAGADIITVHASGGRDMIAAAVESKAEILAITVLTSLTNDAVLAIYNRDVREAVIRLAALAHYAGASGVVCSALELEGLAAFGRHFKRVVPGTRSVGVAAGDQKRVATPTAALAAGADHLVIASQVTKAADPVAAWQKLVDEIAAGQA